MSPTSDLLIGLGELLDAQGVGVWDLAGGYAPTDVAIVLTGFPQTPDRAVSLMAYDIVHDPTLSDSTLGIQARVRGTKNPAIAIGIDDAVFDVMQGLASVTVNGIKIVSVERRSGTQLGADGNGRYERTANYAVMIWRPSPHRT